MLATRRAGTEAELKLRKALHERGVRYRLNATAVAGLRSKPDILFKPAMLAVYVDGCFWHSCPLHGTQPKANATWWRDKFRANRERDLAATAALTRAGWRVLRVWEHEDMSMVARRIVKSVETRLARLSPA